MSFFTTAVTGLKTVVTAVSYTHLKYVFADIMRGTLAACPCPVAPCAARIGKLARLDIYALLVIHLMSCLLYTSLLTIVIEFPLSSF